MEICGSLPMWSICAPPPAVSRPGCRPEVSSRPRPGRAWLPHRWASMPTMANGRCGPSVSCASRRRAPAPSASRTRTRSDRTPTKPSAPSVPSMPSMPSSRSGRRLSRGRAGSGARTLDRRRGAGRARQPGPRAPHPDRCRSRRTPRRRHRDRRVDRLGHRQPHVDERRARPRDDEVVDRDVPRRARGRHRDPHGARHPGRAPGGPMPRAPRGDPRAHLPLRACDGHRPRARQPLRFRPLARRRAPRAHGPDDRALPPPARH